MMDIGKSTPYTDGIRQNAHGSIVYLDPETERTLGPEDHFAHLESKLAPRLPLQMKISQLLNHNMVERLRGLMLENTRPLMGIGEKALHLIQKNQSDKARVLLMGPGAGREIADIQDASVTTTALTPMNPVLQLTKTFETMRDTLWRAIKGQGSKEERTMFSWMKTATSMNPDFALKMDRELQTNVFVPVTQGTVVERQFIGDIVQLNTQLDSMKPQDLIFEHHGPLSKIVHKNMPKEDFQRLAETMRTLAHEQSIVVIGVMTKGLRESVRELFPSFIFTKASGGYTGVHKNGPYAERLHFAPQAATNLSEMEFRQYRFPVGGGPSSNT